jgi:hypothetical protein
MVESGICPLLWFFGKEIRAEKEGNYQILIPKTKFLKKIMLLPPPRERNPKN